MVRKYNTRLIRDDYSYYVEQVVDFLEIDVATVRRWIKEEGLVRIPQTRPYMIHSSELKAFLEKKNAKSKKPCASHEAFCFRCQFPRTPKIGSATISQLANSSLCFKAICSECGGIMNRNIKGIEWTQKQPACHIFK